MDSQEIIKTLKAYKPLNADDFAYIVRAVNAHEELLETLKSARKELGDSTRYDYIDEVIAKTEDH